MATKACVTCGNEFAPGSNRQKYCVECGRRGQGTCQVCGKTFKRSGHDSGRFCSRECFWQSTSNADSARRPCPVCGKEYKPRRAGVKTCSRACAAQLRKRELQTCEVCGKQFDSRHRSRTCSRECGVRLRQAPRPQTCARCGKAMPFFKNRHRRYCSTECRQLPVGTKRTTDQGYVLIKVSNAPAKWIPEHRHVMEQKLGQPLRSDERVHHKHGKRADNREEKLELWKLKGKDPAGQRQIDVAKDVIENLSADERRALLRWLKGKV